MTTRTEIEYHIAGLEKELEDGLARLQNADMATDHVAFYRHWFHRYIQQLREELDSPTPNPHEVAYFAMQAVWLARIWPVLHTDRGRRHGHNPGNEDKAQAAAQRADRCREIAGALPNWTPVLVQRRYRKQFPDEPELTLPTIRRYLKPLKK